MLAERHKVPGAALGILRTGAGRRRPDEVVEAAYGYANFPARIEATTDTLFQIGSMSKVWTATMAMQLVDEGKLDLDAPVADVLPELRLADAEVAKTVTVRHLLNHTSGIDGDVFTDTGRGDDCVEKYVALLAGAEAEPPARRHVVVLQRGLRPRRAGHREAHRPHLGRRAQGADLRAARPEAHGHPARRRRCCSAPPPGTSTSPATRSSPRPGSCRGRSARPG